MNFYETAMGRRFFESQIPKLITALQGISEKLARPVPVIQMPEADPDFLRGLYRNSGVYEPTEETKAINHAAIEVLNELLPLLSDEGRKAFEKYQEIASDRSEEFSERAFRTGFQAAVQMIVCGLALSPKEDNKDD